MSTLTKDALNATLSDLPGWRLSEGKLTRDDTFPGFPAALNFVNQIAVLAESADHHPDIDIRYNKVRLALVSHDTGGITSRDIRLAAAINQHFPQKASA